MAGNDPKPPVDEWYSGRSIDQILPDYDFVERHHIDINAAQLDCYDVARHLEFGDSRIIRWLFTVRRLHSSELSIDAMTAGDTFVVLTEEPPVEFVIGLASAGSAAVAIADADHFADLDLASGLKIAWNFRTQPLDNGCTRLHTETRVACSGRLATIAFSAYWLVVRPFSGLVRREMLKAAQRQAESLRRA